MASDKIPFFPGAHTRIVEPNSDKQIVTVPLTTVDFGARNVTLKQVGEVKNGMTVKHVTGKE